MKKGRHNITRMLFLFVLLTHTVAAVDLEEHFQGKLTIEFGREFMSPFTDKPVKIHHSFISLRYGMPVLAIHPGVVEKAGYLSGYRDLTVIVHHGFGRYFIYSCLSKIEVKPGEQIFKDTVIGAAGGSGDSCGMQGPGVFLLYTDGSKWLAPASL